MIQQITKITTILFKIPLFNVYKKVQQFVNSIYDCGKIKSNGKFFLILLIFLFFPMNLKYICQKKTQYIN